MAKQAVSVEDMRRHIEDLAARYGIKLATRMIKRTAGAARPMAAARSKIIRA
jgi:hypothetical protein